MSEQNQKTVNLNYQGRVDGKVEAFDVNGMMAIPYDQDGVVYVSWDDVLAFFPRASAGQNLPKGSEVAAGILQSFIEHNGPDFATQMQPVIDLLKGKQASDTPRSAETPASE